MRTLTGGMPTNRWTRQTAPLAEIPLSTLNSPITTFVFPGSREAHGLHAPYQRGSVWDEARQRDLIRSLLMHIPVGAILRAKRSGSGDTDEPYYRIVDGKQRIEAIHAFVDGKLAVPADWFPDVSLADVDGDGTVRWAGLSAQGQRGFGNITIAVIELISDTETTEVPEGEGTHGAGRRYVHRRRNADETLAYEAMVYRLINSSGVDQTAADMANAAKTEHGVW